MEKIYENILYAVKLSSYQMMRQMAIGMTSAYLPPVVPRRTVSNQPGTPTPIDFSLRGGKRFAWHRLMTRLAH